ncbi:MULTISPECIES: hypothetical protein [unclassified Mesorhizobium]|uniref:hypothetical protein n=1 Tax=unclassified Mesorhizobium TaxID=325217 RepID=UPI0011279CD6|nr:MULTISPECIES: hypothetical protein [unclassified Mesorhizobium]TPJ45675.1 hypothetical protein FJ437_15705 [Mesorhizobium sp. B2-6-6]MBZ9998522.1 hypothetical protein [Mesorhizobium sp. B264B2A]MCA0005067.1 hypothetical protein [Mesorhizobium sp. B264B1B]MCA0019753.1 hypothetical protein [Mesorhizobium sp. B264B1A]TPJ54251.1 hypothetical protein FJ462_33065 [Mesorhizobium sp. B2-6-7]
MLPETLSALAAWGAASVAAVVAGIQFFIGQKQAAAALTAANAALMNAKNAGRHGIARFRQEWIDKVVDALCEHHSILMTTANGEGRSAGDERRLAALATKIELLLNPDEPDTAALLKAMEDIWRSPDEKSRASNDQKMVVIARRLLKSEWVRLKDELGS